MDLRWITYILLNHFVASQGDPCVTHQTMNDTTYRTDSNTVPLQPSCGLFPLPPWPKWYRFTSTPGGEIATQCPRNSTCGAKNQLWINDTLPSYVDGEKSVRTCLQKSSDCCANGQNIVVKNCNGFYVYRLELFPQCSRFCINATALIPPTVTTTEQVTTKVRSTVSKGNGTTMITKSKQTDVTETTITTLMYSSPSPSTVGLQTSTTNTTSTGTYVPTSLTTKLITRTDSSTPPSSEKSVMPTVVIIVGSVFGLAIVVLVSCLIYGKSRRKKHNKYKTKSTSESQHGIPKAKENDVVSETEFNIQSIGLQGDDT